jgi:hypothetical protein
LIQLALLSKQALACRFQRVTCHCPFWHVAAH